MEPSLSIGSKTLRHICHRALSSWDTAREKIADLDQDLALLVPRCVPDNRETQPGLRELVTKAAHAVRQRDTVFYTGRDDETDEKIKELVQELILNASDGDYCGDGLSQDEDEDENEAGDEDEDEDANGNGNGNRIMNEVIENQHGEAQ